MDRKMLNADKYIRCMYTPSVKPDEHCSCSNASMWFTSPVLFVTAIALQGGQPKLKNGNQSSISFSTRHHSPSQVKWVFVFRRLYDNRFSKKIENWPEFHFLRVFNLINNVKLTAELFWRKFALRMFIQLKCFQFYHRWTLGVLSRRSQIFLLVRPIRVKFISLWVLEVLDIFFAIWRPSGQI